MSWQREETTPAKRGTAGAGPLPPGSLCLCGPTGSGKSSVALLLAQQRNAEILSVDSMQVYRGMDVGTAKPGPAERAAVVHHGIDLVDPDQPFSAAQYLDFATPVARTLAQRGGRLVCCGGTGLYFNALLGGLGTAPAPDPALRMELEATPLAQLLEELQAADAAAFADVDVHNPRRVIRAVEMIRLGRRPAATLRASWTGAAATVPMFALRRHPDDLRRRIHTRVDQMFAAGLVEETRRLLGRGLSQNRTAMQAIGYRQVVEHLQGLRALPETVEIVKQRTWQYARRQGTWFRRQLPVTWVDVAPAEPPEQTAERLLKQWPEL